MYNYKKVISFNQLDKEFEELTEQLGKIKFPKGFLDFFLYSISELFANVKEHSRAKKVFVLIKISKKECRIEIGDNGIGLRKSYLLEKIYPKDDFSAIEFALSGLSTKGSSERGYGFYSIRKLIEGLKGKMAITTGNAFSLIFNNKIEFKKLKKPFKGTKVNLETKIKKINFYQIIR